MRGGVDLGRLPLLLSRRWRFFSAIVLAPATLAYVIGLLLPRWYETGATLNVEATPTLSGASSSVLGIASQLGLGVGALSHGPQFYPDLLTARVLLERVLSAHYPLAHSDSLE